MATLHTATLPTATLPMATLPMATLPTATLPTTTSHITNHESSQTNEDYKRRNEVDNDGNNVESKDNGNEDNEDDEDEYDDGEDDEDCEDYEDEDMQLEESSDDDDNENIPLPAANLYNLEQHPHLIDAVNHWLWYGLSRQNLTPDIQTQLMSLRVRDCTRPLRLYRGIPLGQDAGPETFHSTRVTYTRLTSWSHSRQSARQFALKTNAIGILFILELTKEQVAAHVLIDIEQTLGNVVHQEVILLPGTYFIQTRIVRLGGPLRHDSTSDESQED
jgi:hypothetical protein